jgi:glycosyltransferase involved in cell wall biosynthesis
MRLLVSTAGVLGSPLLWLFAVFLGGGAPGLGRRSLARNRGFGERFWGSLGLVMDNGKRKVLFVSVEGVIGGAERSLLLLVKHLRGKFEVGAACPGGSALAAELEGIGVRVFSLPKVGGKWRVLRLLNLVRAAFCLGGIIRRYKPEVVHANGFWATAASVWPGLVRGKKVIWHARDMTRNKVGVKICGLLSDKVIAVSDSTAEFLAMWGVERGRISVVQNGAEPISDNEAERRNGNGRFVFANVGQFVPWKNQELFIEAAELFVRKGGEAEFVLVGSDVFGRDARYEAQIRERVARSAIRESLEIAGWQDDMEQIWRRVDCLMHTARMEPFGRVVIEAMGHGVPVIAVDSGGPGEIIENGRTGVLVAEHSAETLSEAMLEIVNNRDYAAALARRAKEEVARRFSAEGTAGRTEEIYREVLSV